jgi:transcriptional antiterminator RfaH
MLNAANSHWYVLTSKPKEEQRAYKNLISQGYDIFYQDSQSNKIKGLKQTALQPLFPNYLFVQLDK